MTKYHISPDGNPRACSAESGNCKYGADYPHFNDKEDALKAYEISMAETNPFGFTAGLGRAKKLQTSLKSNLKESGFNVGKVDSINGYDGYYMTVKSNYKELERTLDKFVRKLPEKEMENIELFKAGEGYSAKYPTIAVYA